MGRASTEMRACCGRRVLASVDGDDDGGDARDVDALVEADARAREALEAAEEVVRVEGERVSGGGGARALAVASPASGMASPAVREARRAFEEALVKALEACDAQDALSARVAACE